MKLACSRVIDALENRKYIPMCGANDLVEDILVTLESFQILTGNILAVSCDGLNVMTSYIYLFIIYKMLEVWINGCTCNKKTHIHKTNQDCVSCLFSHAQKDS
jgi:hypothetical protein